MLTALTSGMLLGLSCGLAPGPLLALLLAQTMRHGAREGCKVAVVPLLTDAPIILAALVLAGEAARWRGALGILSMVGGLFVLYLAWDTFRPVRFEAGEAEVGPRSYLKGVLVNLLSPHPWLFWMTIGAASLARARADGWGGVLAFLAMFYGFLVGSKVLVALVSGRSRAFLSGPVYRWVLRFFGLLLAGFAVLLFREGLRQLRGA